MRRFVWLWGALIGAIVLPLAMMMCLTAFDFFLTNPSISLDASGVFQQIAFNLSVTGAGFGFCTITLWKGTRHIGWRLVSAFYGLGAVAYCLWAVWTDFASPLPTDVKSYLALCTLTLFVPIMLWGLALIFFALTVRTRPLNSPML